MKSKISVIVPVYMGENTLIKCVQSILHQTYKDLEIILVDDGSPDNCPAICDRLANEDRRIISLHKPNGGQADARNYGLIHSTGDYIGFVDDDDYLDPQMYEILIRNAINNDIQLSCCANYMVYSDEKVVNRFANMKTGLYNSDIFIHNILYQTKNASGAVWNKIFSRALIDDMVFPSGSQYEDYWMMIRLLYKVKKVYFDSTPLYYWTQSDTSQSKRPYYEGQRTGIDIAKRIRDYLEEEGASSDLLRAAEYFEFLVRHQIVFAMGKTDASYVKHLIGNDYKETLTRGVKLLAERNHSIDVLKILFRDTSILMKVKRG